MREVEAAVEKNERHPGTSCWETSSNPFKEAAFRAAV